jgi:sugar fermentation stimulation protein A
LVADALSRFALSFLKGYRSWIAEAKYGASRFDFKLEYPGGKTAFMEVKSVSLVEEGVGRFPDAPTERGRKHLKELIAFKKEGGRSIVLFVSPRSDTRRITANDGVDPQFGEWLRRAHSAGVELYGYNCKVTADAISLNRPVDVVLA